LALMRVLLTNDDGIRAPGLLRLAQRLVAAGHQVQVLAPDSERSGSAASVGVIVDGAVVRTAQVILPGLPSVDAHAIDGPPALAVHAVWAGLFGPLPDLVVSGINPGHNSGRLVLHSGTVGAALTAAAFGMSGLAVSCGPLPGSRFDTAAEVAARVVDHAVTDPWKGHAINLNVPDVDLAVLRGAKAATPGGEGRSDFSLARLPDGAISVTRFERHDGFGVGTEAALLAEGFASLCVFSPLPGADAAAAPFDLAALVRTLGQRLR
jgi:5'-nucleotidase